MKERALIAMSGGVDSSTAAALMCEAGYHCTGVTMQLCSEAILPSCDRGQAGRDARKVAELLNMEFYELDACEAFEDSVVRYFVTEYEQGNTPNPCIVCNRKMKFGWLLEKADELGCRWIVTGHYARVCRDEKTGRYLLKKAADREKDQTYFLACLNQMQLERIKLPLGEMTKEQVRQAAQQRGFVNARKRDSQDICFVPDGDYVAFMKRYTGKQYPGGTFLDLQGKPVGTHCGAVCYTLGQRRGLGLAMGEPVYVCSKDMVANTVTVGPDEALYEKELVADRWNWILIPELTEPMRVWARVRYRHTEQPAWVYPEEEGRVRVVFDEPQRAITPGQAVVLYLEDAVVGSGTIRKVGPADKA